MNVKFQNLYTLTRADITKIILNRDVMPEYAVCGSCDINFGDGERTENGKID